MQKLIFIYLSLILLFFSCSNPKPETVQQKEPQKIDYLKESKSDKEARMQWWKEARFGMFIHWGLYAVPAGEWNGKRLKEGDGELAEWIMERLDIPLAEYEKIAPQFNPTKFDAEEWVSIAKNAGMKYIVITSKHHDGFALWDSKITEWDIMDATPYGQDILKQLAEACQKEGIKLCFYYSIMDWHHPEAQAIHEPNYNKGPSDTTAINPSFPNYVENYMKPQIEELLTNYGDIGVIWFDGEWIPDYTTEMGKEMYQFIREKRPDMIINNRVDKGREGMAGMNKEGDFAGDFGTPEQEVPETGLPGADWESCITMNTSWGYKHFDDDWKSSEQLIRQLVDIVSKGGNFLLNVGPTAEGLIPAPSIERLARMGEWIEVNGEAIYDTQSSPVEAPAWGRITSKEKTLYLHVFDWPTDGKLSLEAIEGTPTSVSLLADGSNLELSSEEEEGSFVLLPKTAPDEICSVIKLVF